MKDLRILPKIRDSFSYLYIEQGIIEQDDKSIAVFDNTGKVQIPVASLTLLMLGPGTKITHAAIKTTCDAGCLIAWTGEESVRFYAVGKGETNSSESIIKQALLFADNKSRVEIAKKMYNKRFSDILPDDITIEQLRGKEGVRVRAIYKLNSEKYNVPWHGRKYDRKNWEKGSDVDRAVSVANSCLYGVCHSAIVALGYSPALGFIHTGKQLAFVYDIADFYKAELTIPIAFEMISKKTKDYERNIRLHLRDEFKNQRILSRIVEDIQELMDHDSSQHSPFDSDPAKPGFLLGEESISQGGKNHGGDHS
ncbi:type I-E CRISPR-associated endonuclease Cas1e [Fluviispira multicolorata]|uniref:CRISPR-associated endonuclease Cas1 n=1 Tax=Fluviispira multicolorata TaxID=2654512 RepID=A0A833JE86_9BACT|nr:type I-E CRISPR-associated endonuclease Cas1e [Fluviispira multicolorata]KAB8032265.1 type I-E CRISPR-associated endonuclease Cas1 [Fluviispira multicolorata]